MHTHMTSWRRHLRPSHVYWVLVAIALVCGVAIMWHLGVWAQLGLTVFSLSFMMWQFLTLKLDPNERLIQLWGRITGQIPVRIMQYDHKVKITLMRRAPDGAFEGYLSWNYEVGQIRLLPNGHVDPEGECSFCYVWEPLDTELKTELQLTYWDEWPNWNTWLQKSHQDMIEYRKSHLT